MEYCQFSLVMTQTAKSRFCRFDLLTIQSAFSLIQNVKFSTQLLFIMKSGAMLERVEWSCSPISENYKSCFGYLYRGLGF